MPSIQKRVTGLVVAVICAVVLVPRASAQTPTPAERSKQMKIRIGSKNFIAVLDDNATAAAFKALLPMTVEMTELNGNEKYARLSGNLPTKAANLGTIQTGDLMIYGSKSQHVQHMQKALTQHAVVAYTYNAAHG
jgi:hypothetical protein